MPFNAKYIRRERQAAFIMQGHEGGGGEGGGSKGREHGGPSQTVADTAPSIYNHRDTEKYTRAITKGEKEPPGWYIYLRKGVSAGWCVGSFSCNMQQTHP